MSDGEDDGVPDSATAQKLVKEFEHITNTDEIMAQMFLQDNAWDLSKALNNFFAKKCEKIEADKVEEILEAEAIRENNDKEVSVEAALEAGVLTTQAPTQLTFVTWNIDGLDKKNLKRRTRAVIEIVQKVAADIVFLQEVVPETFSYMESKLPNYECFAAKQQDYFVATLLRKGRVYHDKVKLVEYPTSRMGRHLLAIRAHCGSVVMDLFNTHLESTVEHAQERMKQLEQCFDIITRRPSHSTVIFAGDLNMRDKELSSVGLPGSMVDVWESLGSRPEAKYTWDMTRNTNLEWAGKFKPKCRFDRVYVRFSETRNMDPQQFGLLGLEKVEATQSYPSDHWGIRVSLKLSQE